MQAVYDAQGGAPLRPVFKSPPDEIRSVVQVTSALIVLSPAWNATLFFVMAGALVVALPVFQLMIVKRTRALDGSQLYLPDGSQIDARLVIGAVLFGAGWGLGGVCPGPGVVALASREPKMLALVASMLGGMTATAAIGRAHGKRASAKKQA